MDGRVTPSRQKPGPRPGTTGAGRTARLILRVAPADKAAYTAAAERQGVSVAEWARVALDDVSRIEAQLADAVSDGPRVSESEGSS